MKTWLTLGLILLSGSAYARSSCPADADYIPIAKRYEQGAIFQITRCDTPPSIIVGTFHSDSARLDPIYKQYLAAMMKQELAGFEINQTPATQQQALQFMLYSPQQKEGLEQHLTTEEFAALSARLQEYAQLPELVIRRLRPWAANVLLDYPAQTRDGIALDFRLQQAAKTSGKAVIGLETISEQLSIFASLPEAKQVELLKETIKNIPQLDAQHEEMFRMFTEKELDELHRFAQNIINAMQDKEFAVYFREKLIHERNQRMVERMDKHLSGKKGFYAVGALHLLGDEGMLPLLEKRGYHISVMDGG